VQARMGLRARARGRRRNAAFVRQASGFSSRSLRWAVDEKLVLRDEPLTRGNGGKPHWASFATGRGGETVYVCSQYPTGVSEGAVQDHPGPAT